VNRRELSEVVAEAAARTERAAAMQREAIARQEAATAKLEEIEARREAEGDWMRQAGERQERMIERQDKRDARQEERDERQEKMLQDYIRRTDEMIAEGRARTEQIAGELKDQQDERRALIEALFRVMDRLPPPPPHLRSV
jgi:hypothetical protein